MQQIVEIKALSNGAHRNQTGQFTIIPEGYAVIPENMELENFPFGEMETAIINGILTVTKWIPGVMPEPEPEPGPTEVEQLRADVDYIAVMTGVEL